MEEQITKGLELDSARGTIFHICSFQELIKTKVPNYSLEIDGVIDITRKYYLEGYTVKQVPCNKPGNTTCCKKPDCLGHIEISI
jgi:hypothetical protein